MGVWLPRFSLAIAGSFIAFWSVILPVIGLLYLCGQLPANPTAYDQSAAIEVGGAAPALQ
jgi:hypothetical protein